VCFALLCCLNTLSIEYWEGGASNEGSPVASERLSLMAGGLAAAALAAMALSAIFGGACVELLAVALGAVLLLVVHVASRKFSAEALRVLADVALVVPAVVMLAYVSW
jgi:ABC-type Mn2+/Zn2+ transport system permease subunit